VTLDGTLGKGRDQRTRTSPTFAKYSRPFDLTLNPLLLSRNDCRRSFLDFFRGSPICRPLRFPVQESTKFRHARWESFRTVSAGTDN
jgi:hypothetical protein